MTLLGTASCAVILSGLGNFGDLSAQTYTARIGHVENADQPRHIIINQVAELVSERTDGDVEFTIFPSSQLGGQREMNEGVQLGTLEGTISATSWMGGFNPYVTILDIPYFIPSDPDDAQQLRESEFGQRLLQTFEAPGYHAVAFWPFGFKQMTSNRPLDNITDIGGQRFRVMASDILMAQFDALGASSVALPFGELYTSLQNNVVDGQENPISSILSMRFYEVQDNILISDHGAIEDVIVFNPAWWDSLPENYQTIITETFIEVVPALTELYAVQREEGIGIIEASGTNVRYITEEEQNTLREMAFGPTMQVYLDRNGELGAELRDLYQAAYDEIPAN
jgi:C4-dicarboxylate-binding protein DctP